MYQLGDDIGTTMHRITFCNNRPTAFRHIDLYPATEVHEAAAFTLPNSITDTDIAARLIFQRTPCHDHDDIITLIGLQPDAMRTIAILRTVRWLEHLALNGTARCKNAVGRHLYHHTDTLSVSSAYRM